MDTRRDSGIGRAGIVARVARGLIIGAFAVALLGPTAPVGATVITVTSTADDFTNNGNCTLREAIASANGNFARDACTAGSNTETDEVVLADGAVYSLVIPFSGPDTGPLVVTNNTATFDLTLRVANDGEATISQDAVPDTHVIVVQTNARLRVFDVKVTGGFVSTGNGPGGGISVLNGAQLGLERCEVSDNVSQNGGGGVGAFQGATVTAVDTVFRRNLANDSGGAIVSGSNTSVLLQRARFVDNHAIGQFSNGGALGIAAQTSIVDTVFINNSAAGGGGALSYFHDVADQSSITNSCFIGNQGKFDGNAVQVFGGSTVLNARSNWWGASNGPSGVGPGVGDGVGADVDFAFDLDGPPTACLPMPLLANGGFEIDLDGDSRPDRWTPGQLTSADGLRCGKRGCSMRIFGNAASKSIQQIMPVRGNAGDLLTFKARADAKDVPTGTQAFRVRFTILHEDDTKQDVIANFNAGTHAFKAFAQQVAAAKAYKRITARVEFARPSGRARFDDVTVTRN